MTTFLRAANRLRPGRDGVALVLLVASLVVGCAQIHLHTDPDEGAGIMTGILVAQGASLYRDVFAHHFPFQYAWIAAVATVCGPSITAMRLAVALYTWAGFAMPFALTSYRSSIAAAALAWSAIGHLYFGNMPLYYTLKGPLLLGALVSTLTLTSDAPRRDRALLAYFAVCATAAVLCDPFAVPPVALCLVVLGLARGPRLVLLLCTVIATVLLSVVAYFWVQGTLPDAVRDAITFNTAIYSHYLPTEAVSARRFFRQLTSGLGMNSTRWLVLDPTLPLSPIAPDRWLFTGFLFRSAVLGASLMAIARGDYRTGVFVYLFAATLVFAGNEGRRAVPFVVTALFCATWLVTGEPHWGRVRTAARDSRLVRRAVVSVRWMLATAARLAVASMVAWLTIRGLATIAADRDRLSYRVTFGPLMARAADLRAAACGRTDVGLVVYPTEPLLHLFSGLQPASRHLFMLPWVADVALAEVERALALRDAVVRIDVDGNVWGIPNRQYMEPLLTFLDRHYRRLSDGLYVSPALWNACHAPSKR